MLGYPAVSASWDALPHPLCAALGWPPCLASPPPQPPAGLLPGPTGPEMLKPLAEMPVGPHPANPKADPAGWSQACPSSQSPQRCLPGHGQRGFPQGWHFPACSTHLFGQTILCLWCAGERPLGQGVGRKLLLSRCSKQNPTKSRSKYFLRSHENAPSALCQPCHDQPGRTRWVGFSPSAFPQLPCDGRYPFLSPRAASATAVRPHAATKTDVWGRAPWCGAVLASRRVRAGTVCPAPLTQLLSVRCASCPPLPLPCLVPALWQGHPWARSLKSLIRPYTSLQAPFR